MSYKELVEGQQLNTMSSEQLVAYCVELDKKRKEGTAMLNRYKAELQARGLQEMENTNTRYVKYYSDCGTAAITDSMSLDILSPDKLKELLGEGLWSMKIKENVKTEHKCDTKLERALKAIFTGDYTFEMGLTEFIRTQLPPMPADKKLLLMKKLKGDYEKDKELLQRVLETEADLDVELWYIYRIKNAELIAAFLPSEGLDARIEAIRKCILVENKTSITIDYDEEKEEKAG